MTRAEPARHSEYEVAAEKARAMSDEDLYRTVHALNLCGYHREAASHAVVEQCVQAHSKALAFRYRGYSIRNASFAEAYFREYDTREPLAQARQEAIEAEFEASPDDYSPGGKPNRPANDSLPAFLNRRIGLGFCLTHLVALAFVIVVEPFGGDLDTVFKLYCVLMAAAGAVWFANGTSPERSSTTDSATREESDHG